MAKQKQPAREPTNGKAPGEFDSGEFYVRYQCDQFERTKDPLALLEAFIHSVHIGRNPPALILEALAKAFQTVIDSKGKKNLDVELGLKRTGRGAWSIFTKKKRDNTVHWLAAILFALTTYYDLSLEEAAERVSLFLESDPRLKPYTADSLSQQYSRVWKKHFRFDNHDPASDIHPANWTPERRKVFIQQFPSTRIV